LVLTQDGNLRTATANNFGSRGWLFTKYDQFGRVVYTGFFPNSATRTSMQSALDSMVQNAGNNEERTTSATVTLQGMPLYYNNKGFPTGNKILLSVNYYDTYPSDAPAIPTTIFSQNVLTQESQNTTISTKSLLTASYIKNIEDSKWTKNYTWYDTKGRVIGTHSINYLGGYTKTENELDFTGQVLQSLVTHKRGGISMTGEVQIKERFLYDGQNRLVSHYHKVDNRAEILLAYHHYDELGRLKSKTVGNNLETVNYQYNIRGWLQGINLKNVDNTLQLDPQKLFSYRIRYEDSEISSLRKYNGNISETQWSYGTATSQKYQYHYDALNRLTLADSKRISTTGTSDSGYYNESLTYDLNGNIKTLNRYGLTSRETSGAVKMDELTYNYNNSNRLISIVDATSNASGYPGGGGTITYDSNGNMLTMPDKGISTAIEYNYLNLPEKIVQSGNPTEYTYRSDGEKVKKSLTINDKNIQTDYLDGFVYGYRYDSAVSMALSLDDAVTQSIVTAGQTESLVLTDKDIEPIISLDTARLEFFPTSEGFYDYLNFKYIYQYKDQLGNTRVSYSQNSSGIGATIEEVNSYYPFGLNHYLGLSDIGNGAVSTILPSYTPVASYKNYKYNGKELQETGMYDYGARFYMPDIGRWGVQDQLSEKFFSNSNYNYVGNNPILIFDPDGRDWYYTNDGHYEFNKGLTKDNAEQFFKDNNIEGAKYAFENNTMGSMYYGSNGIIYDDSAAGGGLPYESGKVKNIDEVVINTPKAIANRNIEAARSRLREAEANYWGGYAYGLTVGYKFGNAGSSISLFQNFGTGQAKLLGTTSLGTEQSYGFTFQFNTLATYGNNPDGSKYKDVFGGALGSGTEASASYIFGGSVSRSTEDNSLLPAPRGTTTTGINLGPSIGGGVSRTSTTDLTPALNRFLKFNWIP
ncbi:RHS repeat-associated core domain-containing protein, partial [Weeksellaceae bacterium A-14]